MRENKTKILIVEDEMMIAMDLKMRLAKLGYEVSKVVTTGEEALTAVEKACPDLILMDILLDGEIDGIETARIIQEKNSIPIVYLTSIADKETIKRVRATQAYGYLLKPIDAKVLEAILEIAIFKHQADKSVKESEEWLFTTLKSIRDAVIATNNKGKIEFLNKAAHDLFSLPEGNILGKNIDSFVNLYNGSKGDKISSVIEFIQNAENNSSFFTDLWLVSNNKSLYSIELSISPIRAEHKNTIGYISVFRDITSKKRAEEEQKRILKLLNAVFAQSNDAMLVIDIDTWQINTFNEKAIEFLKIQYFDDLQHKELNKIIQTIAYENFQEKLILELKNKDAWSTELEILAHDFSIIWGDFFIKRLQLEHSNKAFIRITDISEKKYNERQLIILNTAIENVSDNIVIFKNKESLNPKLLYANKQFLFLSGLKNSKDAHLSDWTDLKNEHIKTIAESIKIRDESIIHIEMNTNGKNLILEWIVSPIFNQNDEISSYIAIIRDITIAKQMEKERIQMQLEKQRSVMNAIVETQESERMRISGDLHDSLGQLLSAAKLNFNSLTDDIQFKNKNKKKNYLEAIKMIDQSTQEVRSISHNLSPMMLKQLGLVASLEVLTERISTNKNISAEFVAVGLGKGELWTKIEVVIYRIFQELLNNAIKHSKAEEIILQLRKTNNTLKLIYDDDGIGFDSDKLEKLKKGIGLRNIEIRSKLLKGNLEIESAPGKGVHIIITIPINELKEDDLIS